MVIIRDKGRIRKTRQEIILAVKMLNDDDQGSYSGGSDRIMYLQKSYWGVVVVVVVLTN